MLECESQLFNKLSIWYDTDLSSTYLSIIPKDLLTILKRMVKIYVLASESKSKTYCPRCHCILRGGLIYYGSGAEVYDPESGRLFLYECEPCYIAYAVSGRPTVTGCVCVY